MTPDRLLAAESLALMFTSHVSVPDSVGEIHGASYGYGWFRAEIGGHHVCFHPGDNSGFGALNLLVPAEVLTIILLANDEELDLWHLGQTLLDQALEEAWEAEREADRHASVCARCDSISSVFRSVRNGENGPTFG